MSDPYFNFYSKQEQPKFHSAVILIACIVCAGIIILIAGYFQTARAEVITSTAIIHHSASPDVSAKTIDRYHKSKGWSGIGYHFVIRKDGTIEKGRSLSKSGAHAKGRNNYVGICLTGYDTFTPAQISSLTKLLNNLGTKQVERHHENCPGKGLNMQLVQNSLRTRLAKGAY